MNINKFTQKSMEAVQNCEKLAYEYGNQQIDEQHLLYSLLTLEDSLILKLVTKMGTPTWLLLLPGVLYTRNPALRASAIISLVVVFPTLPVIPTSGRVRRFLQKLPRS